MKNKIATNRLLDSVWTLEYQELNTGEIEIISYSRDNPYGYDREREVPMVRLVEEDPNRTVKAVRFAEYEQFGRCTKWGESIPVANPKPVFQYPYQGQVQ